MIASLAAVLVSALLLEVGVRQLDLLDTLAPFPRDLFAPGGAPGLPYRLRPDADVMHGDVRVRVNAFGLRGGEIAPRPEGDTERILVLGDSVAFGHLLDEPETFPVALEDELRRRGRRVEVLNGAAPGYDTAAELAFLRAVGLDLAPRALVLCVSLNDFDPAPKLTSLGFLVKAPGGEPARTPWLAARSEAYALVRGLWSARKSLWDRMRGARDESDWAALDRYVAAAHKRFYHQPAGPGWTRLRRSLRALGEIARARGLELHVVIFPEKDQVGVAEPDLAPQARFRELCAELALRCVDPLPAFAAAADGGASLFADVQHPNALGLRVAARATAEAISP